MRPRLIARLARLWGLVLALAFTVVAGAATTPGVDAAWREWRAQLLLRAHSDPESLMDEARHRHQAALAAGDARAQGRAVAEMQAAIVAQEAGPGRDLGAEAEAAIAAARLRGDRVVLFDVLEARWVMLLLRLKWREAAAIADELSLLADELGDPARRALAWRAKAWLASQNGDSAEALRLFNLALEAAVDDGLRADLLMGMANVVPLDVRDASTLETRVGWLRRAQALLDPQRYPYAGFLSHAMMARLLERADRDRALQAYATALDLALRLHNPRLVALTRAEMSRVLAEMGRPDEALAHARLALEPLAHPTTGRADMLNVVYMAMALALAGKGDASALAWLQKSAELVQGPLASVDRFRGYHQLVSARVHAALGQWREAYESLEARRSTDERTANAEAARHAQALQARYESRFKEQENEMLRASEAALRERRFALTLGLAAATAFSALLLWLLVRLLRQKRGLQWLRDELAERNRELQNANTSRTRLLAAACHDLRQPAHALGLLAEMAASSADNVDRRRKLDGIQRCSAALSEMLGLLMDMTQLEGGHYAPVLGDVPLDDMLSEVESQFALAAARKGLALVAQRTGIVVRSDRQLLRRILFNLVSNAIRYTPHGTVSIEAWEEGPAVLLLVSDTGPGIPPERMADVFADHVRLDPRAQEGLGIGLPIVKRAAELLGHELTLDSRPGQGTHISVRLPLLLHSPGGALTAAGQRMAPGGQLLALLEDDAEAAQATADFLRRTGFHVLLAQSAAELLEAAGGRRPALVMTDLQLGNGLDGLEQLHELRRQWPHVPGLLVTGDLGAEVASRAASQNVLVAYKPLPPQRLLARIGEGLARAAKATPGA